MAATKAQSIARQVLPLTREDNAHKYDFGHLLVIGGNQVYSGSPAFNSLAAYRTGVDLVTTAAPERPADIIASFSPSLITYPLQGNYLNSLHLNQLFKLSDKCDAVVIGGGLGRKQETKEAVVRFLSDLQLPCVIDADAIQAVAEAEALALNKKQMLTPHQREFELLWSKKARVEAEEREKSVERVSKELNCSLLLKGDNDVISNGERTVINEVGSPFLTKGGTGDTLAGIAGSLLAQGIKPLQAAAAASYLNGKAGELAAKEKKEGLLAEDILEKLSRVWKELR